MEYEPAFSQLNHIENVKSAKYISLNTMGWNEQN